MARDTDPDEFRVFFELAGVGNAIVDASTRKFVLVNHRFEEITGYTAAELRDLTFDDITHPDDRAYDLSRFRELVEGHATIVRLEKRYLRKDRSIVWVHLTTTLTCGPDGTPRHQLGIIADISARKNAEAELHELHGSLQRLVDERTAALADKSAQFEAFVYTVAHDLRAPLRAINGYAEFVSEDATSALSPGSITYLDRIKKAAKRMDRLIRDLLSYTRVTQIALKIEKVPLEECVDWAISGLREQIAARGARVTVDQPLPRVAGERGSLEQVIGHLLDNALKFVAANTPPQIRVYAESHGDFVRLCIADNGIGIRPEFHDRVFRIFERLEDARGYPGTGVGLPIVHKTIERLGGRVGVESTDEGSVFWFELRKANS